MNTGLWIERIKRCLALRRPGTARYMCMHVTQPVSLHNSAVLKDTILPASFKGLYFTYATHQNDHILNTWSGTGVHKWLVLYSRKIYFPKLKRVFFQRGEKLKTSCWIVQNKHLHLGVHEAVGATLRICVGRMPAGSRWLLFYFIA